jgi:WS/DGAT/MGAT family acyltransferase
MKLLQAVHDAASSPASSSAENHSFPEAGQLLQSAGRNLLASPLQSAKGLYRQWQQLKSSGRAATPQPPVPKSLFNAPVGPEKSFTGCRLPLHDIRDIKSLVEGATVNDALLAICGGGLHRYLSSKGRLPNIPLVAWVPINARTESSQNQDGNNITATAIRIGTQLSDPLERLAVIRQHTLDAKLARTGRSARVMTELTQHLPGPVLAPFTKLLMASGATSKMCNLAISNMPGPQQSLYLSSAECLEYYGMVPLGDEMGLFIVAMSYNGIISLSITSTAEILPDPEFFVDCLLEEFHAYKTVLSDQHCHAPK